MHAGGQNVDDEGDVNVGDDAQPSSRRRRRKTAQAAASAASSSSSSSRRRSSKKRPAYKTAKSLPPDAPPEDKERLRARLKRKAELARASRRRKKAYVQDLHAKVHELGVKLEETQLKLADALARKDDALTEEEAKRR